MPPSGLSAAVARARRAVAPADPRSDGALLAAFVAARDGAAFAALVERFGPMVFAVCRRVTGRHHDAEDAFQAVFVVLARKAAAVVPREAVGGWLYGVAVRTAREARAMAARRSAREVPSSGALEATCGFAPDAPDPDLASVIDAELAALSEKDRTLLVRCDLRDEPQTAVAAALGVPVGTVYSRLAAARKRLTARGVAPGAGALAVALGDAARAAVPADLPARAVASALAPEHAPAAVAALSNGVLRAMLLHKLRLAPLAVVAVAASAAVAAGLLAAPPAPDAPPDPVAVAAAQPAAPKAAPLPKGPNKILINKNRSLVLIDPDGKNETRLTEHDPETGFAFDAKLSPDGKRLAVVRSVTSAPGEQVVRRSLFVHTLGTKTEPVDLKIDCEGVYWSADGSELVAGRASGRPGVPEGARFDHRTVDARTGKAARVKLPPDYLVTGWLADGRFVTTKLTGTPAAPEGRVYLMNRDGTESKAVTDGTTVVASSLPSPDGRRLLGVRPVFKAVGGRTESERDELVLIDVATGRVTPVADVPANGDVQGACWSPDGTKIAYTWRQRHEGTEDERARKETESRLVVADADGENPRTILTAKSPGQWILALGSIDWR